MTCLYFTGWLHIHLHMVNDYEEFALCIGEIATPEVSLVQRIPQLVVLCLVIVRMKVAERTLDGSSRNVQAHKNGFSDLPPLMCPHPELGCGC